MSLLNQPPIQTAPDNPKRNQWLTIADFSPGIQQKIMTPGVIQPSPGNQGAASIQNTYRCISLPSGGLGPLPSRYYTFHSPTPAAPTLITNFYVVPTTYETGTDPVYHSRNTDNHFVLFMVGSTHNDAANSYNRLDIYDPTQNLVNTPYNFTTPYIEHQNAAPYFCASRAQPTSSVNTGENTMLGIPIVVVSYLSSDLANYFTACFPNPILPLSPFWSYYDYNVGATNVTPPAGGTPSHTVTYNIPAFVQNAGDLYVNFPGAQGMCVAHQGRVLFFPLNEEHAVQGGPTSPQPTLRYHNEWCTYTFPNDLRQDGIQNWSGQGIVNGVSGTVSGTTYEVVFGQESPVGIGVAESLSSSDLLIIKHDHGAYLVQGDLNAATVRRLPHVISTSGLRTSGTFSPVGYVYGVNRGGVYAWTGGDASQKLSPQLEDDFWITPNSDSINQFRGSFVNWNDWVLSPNNWLLDTESSSWWRIEDESIARWHCWQRDPITNVVYGARDFLPLEATPPMIDGWDRSRPSSSYSWQSHPMGASVERLMELRCALLFVQGQGKITLTFTDPEAVPVMEQIELPPQALDGPVAIRKPTYFQANSITLRIQADSLDPTVPAPIVYQVSLCYDEGLPVEEALT